MSRELIQVSPEMITLIGGRGLLDPNGWPGDPIAFTFQHSDPCATVAYHPHADATVLEGVQATLILIVARAACCRIFGALPEAEEVFHAPPSLRAIAAAIRSCALPEPARTTLRLAKSIELLCETFTLLGEDALIPAGRNVQLSYRDCQRIHDARRLIEARWHEKLTLDSIASACGLNRSKLARGFRGMYNSSVADLIAEQRLGQARRMLVSTELPIGSIGYRCGYGNNAAFTRAFARRYGAPPSSIRAAALNA